jgi:hypothetical protein
VELVLSDTSKYKKLRADNAKMYQIQIKNWSIQEDIGQFLVLEDVSTPHLKAMIKTHKPNCPVWLTLSSVGSTTSNLSTTLDHVYLKPSIAAGECSRRLGDTREAFLFIEQANDYIWDKIVKETFTEALTVDNILNCLFPKSSLLVAYSRIPQPSASFVCKLPNRLATPTPPLSLPWICESWLQVDGVQSPCFFFQICFSSIYAWLLF